MAQVFQIALVLDGLLLALGLEGFRRRLAMLLGHRVQPNEYPSTYVGFSPWMGWLVVWTTEHRSYHDRWLSRFAWTARLAMLGVPAIVLVYVLVGES
jgi:hypothetical protein